MYTARSILAALAAASLCAPVSAAPDEAPGKSLFQQKNCAVCHSVGQADEQPDKLDLDSMPLPVDPLALGAVLWNHGPLLREWKEVLPPADTAQHPWPPFQPGELETLQAWLRTEAHSPPGAYLAGADPAAGREVFQQRCSSCHGLAAGAHGAGPAQSSPLGADLRPLARRSTLATSLANHAPMLFQQPSSTSDSSEVPPEVLTAREASDLAAWILDQLSVPPAPTPTAPPALTPAPTSAPAFTPVPAASTPGLPAPTPAPGG